VSSSAAKNGYGGGAPNRRGDGFSFDASLVLLPHPQKADKGGEDAGYVDRRGLVLSIADGVGGWAELGVDPAEYPRCLMRALAQSLDKFDEIQPLFLMEKAARECDGVQGSATMLVASLDADSATLRYANLGDSGIMILRSGDVFHRSVEQQHYFNCPYQLGTSGDKPSKSERIALQLLPSDRLVIATDGLWDNVFDNEIVDAVAAHRRPADAARHLADAARTLSLDSSRQSPFMQKAGRPSGGKVDDIGIIIADVMVE
jgi:protein phosphatase PTC7